MKPSRQSSQVVPREYHNKISIDDLQACKKALNNGSRSFLAASHLLPTQTRDASTALYAFCREADDIIDNAAVDDNGSSVNRHLADEWQTGSSLSSASVDDRPGDDGSDGAETRARVSMLASQAVLTVGQRIEAVYRGQPQDSSADRALTSVARHYVLPRTLLDAMLEGFEWDAQERQYQTFDDVVDYAARVAGTVGAMMVLLMGVREPQVVARACDLGIAMQLTNICRDVGDDARAGRCYLPRNWMEAEGIDTDLWLQDPCCELGIERVVQRMLREADLLYKRADAGIAALPRRYQRGIRAARLLYAAIGDEVARRDFNSVDSRAVVGKQEKLRLLAKTLCPLSTNPALLELPALQGTRFLVEAVVGATPEVSVSTDHGLVESKQGARDEMGSVIELFGRLESQRRASLQIGKIPMQPLHNKHA